MTNPYRAPMPQPPAPRDPMRVVLFVAGGVAIAIAATAITVGMLDTRGSVATTSTATESKPVPKELDDSRDPPEAPLAADSSETPPDFDVTYTSPNSMVPSYTVQIDATGTATMRYLDGYGVIATLAPNVVRDLWHIANRHRFAEWHSDLTSDHPGVTDHFPLSIAITARGLRKEVRCLDRCPAGTRDIIELIHREAKPRDWTGSRGKKLPRANRDLNSLLDTR